MKIKVGVFTVLVGTGILFGCSSSPTQVANQSHVDAEAKYSEAKCYKRVPYPGQRLDNTVRDIEIPCENNE